MSVRIVHPVTKIGVVLGVGIAATLTAPLLAAATGSSDLARLAGQVLAIAGILCCTRVFRGPSENVCAPRAWWRATEKPPAGFVVGAVLLFSIANVAVAEPAPSAAWAAVSVVLLLAAAAWFFHSSVRRARRSTPD
ncbi:hypothetical protein [Microbacterium aurantiacum]|uniref:hypothetical protein n=1 Tax=Microbacterium aurantiacum TaxID=162393 RepID=UPI00342FC51E